MSFGDVVVAIVSIISGAGVLMTYFVASHWGRTKQEKKDFQQMRNTLGALEENVRRIDSRLQTVESMIASGDLLAAQRVAAASVGSVGLDSSRAISEMDAKVPERQQVRSR